MKINFIGLLFFGFMVHILAQASLCQQHDLDKDKEIEFLIEVTDRENKIVKTYISPNVEKNAEKRKGMRNELIASNKRAKDEWERVESVMANMGEEVIDPMLKKYKKVAYRGYKSLTVRVLAQIATPRSQLVLKDMALGKGLFEGDTNSTAAWSYLKNLKNKREGIELIDCEDRNVKSAVLQRLKGVPIDSFLFNKISPYLVGSDTGLRISAGSVLAADPGDAFVRDTVKALVNSMETVQDLTGVNEQYLDRGGTLKEVLYLRAINALRDMKGADDAIREALKDAQGEPKLYIVMAMASRGDMSFKGDLWKVIHNKEVGLNTKTWALGALGKIGSNDDLAKLKLLEQDDLVIVTWKGKHIEMRNGRIIGEDSPEWEFFDMMSVYEDIEKNAKKFYPIRYAAKQAIKNISEKSN